MAYRGDLIGCSIKFERIWSGKVPVVFTLNGKRITEDEIWIDYTPGGKLPYPYIGMAHEGMRVLAKVSVYANNSVDDLSDTEKLTGVEGATSR